MPRSRAEWDEELAAGMLEDLEKISGISIGEMMADALEVYEPVYPAELQRGDEGAEFEVFPVFEEPTDDEKLDMDSPEFPDTDDYFDALFDDIDVDPDEEDAYGDEGN